MGRPKGAKDKVPRKPTGQVKGIAKMLNPDVPEGYNTKMIQFLIDITPTEPLDKSDPVKMAEEMERRFMRYLNICAERDIKIGNQAAYMAMGVDKGTVWEWLNRNHTNPAITDLLRKVQHFCANYRESLMVDGKVNPVVGIFWQKNYDGLRDQQEVVLTPNNPLGDTIDTETLKQKYLENTYGMIETKESAESVIEKVAEAQKEKI